MERKWIWKVILALILVIVAAIASITTVVPKPTGEGVKDPVPEMVRNLFPGINLGLDLQGGLRLQYEVEVAAAVEDKREQTAKGIVDNLAEKVEIKGVKILRDKETDYKWVLEFPSEEERASQDTAEILKDYRQTAVVEMEEGPQISMTLVEAVVENTEQMAVKQAIETIGNRIDELGLVNTSVSSSGIDIFVEIPGIDESRVARIKRIISTTARLEFKIVDEDGSAEFFTGIADKLEKDGPIKLMNERVSNGEGSMAQSYYLEAKNDSEGFSGRQILKKFIKDNEIEVPENRIIAFNKNQATDDQGNPTADISWRTYYLERTAGVTGEYVENAMVLNDDSTGQPYVSLSFNQEGAKIFEELTGANVKRRMAIQLDDRVQSAPTIQEKIPGGQARITMGGFESYQTLFQDAQDLVVVLRAGALPAPVRPVTETNIGPQMGQDSIRMGSIAFAVGGLVILIFMLIYYKGGGVAADLALLCNALFIMGILGGAEATLTLPGIAGIILTIGMAVDANVIIYERIREELRAGKSPRAAVDAGYKRAFWTIFDAQITTFIAGVVMLQYGTGAIKGFAVTLLIGIVTSMFSAIFVSRLVFDFMTRRRSEHLSI